VNQCNIQLRNASATNDFNQYWRGASTAKFLAPGPLLINFTFAFYPRNFTLYERHFQEWKGSQLVSLQFREIDISSGQIIQQEQTNDVTLSLTYVVLFFASLDIGVVFYDHSEDDDEDKQTDYHKRKEEKKRCYRNEERLYVI
jgi:hypothetical protein